MENLFMSPVAMEQFLFTAGNLQTKCACQLLCKRLTERYAVKHSHGTSFSFRHTERPDLETAPVYNDAAKRVCVEPPRFGFIGRSLGQYCDRGFSSWPHRTRIIGK